MPPAVSATLRNARPAACLAALLLAGCAGTGTGPAAPARDVVAPAAPAAWQAPLPPGAAQAPLPHQGQWADLSRWWQQFDDPALAPLIDAAQAASPTLSAAQARIAQARATRVAAGAALGPTADASASAQRSGADLTNSLPAAATRLNAGVSAAWEIDMFGGNAAARDAAQARLEGAQAQWHDARVAVATEVADQFNSLRACEAQLAQTRLDAASRFETSRLTELSAKAGFQAPATAALARASAAQASALATQQQTQCEGNVKALVVLTARDEPALRSALAAGSGRQPQPAALAVPALPAALLRQRPDLANAERELLAAQGDLGQARAARLPRIVLAGNIGRTRIDTGGFNVSDNTWSFGPLTVSLPLFDGGARRANVAAADARVAATRLQYAAKLRTAVREVEDALLALDNAARRRTDLAAADDGFAASLRATEALNRGGLASLFELEDARRSARAARSALIDLQREQVAAWIALYRALGGGWSEAGAGQPGHHAASQAPTPTLPQRGREPVQSP